MNATEHRLWHIADRLPEGTTRIRCPYCADQRRAANRSTRTLSITVQGRVALYTCHHCNESGRISLDREMLERRRDSYQRSNSKVGQPQPIAFNLNLNQSPRQISQAHLQYLEGRHISPQTASHGGVFTMDYYIREVGEVPCLAFPYASATKFKATHVRGYASSGAAQTYYLAEKLEPGHPVIITEGELDALSMVEAGLKNAVSVPNGAPQSVSQNNKVLPKDDTKYRYVWTLESWYKDGRKVIIATDNDDPGDALAEELARRIGKYRCYRVKFPHGIKDANEALVKLGAEALVDLVGAAEPWPVKGLFETSHYEGRVLDLYNRGEGRGSSTGLPAVDKYYTVAPGQFTIVTGIPSSGKSEFIDHLAVELATREGWRFAVASFENPPESHIVKLIEKRARVPFYDNHAGDGVNGAKVRIAAPDLRENMSWVSDHFFWIEHSDGAPSTIDDILERAKVAVMRYGVRGVIIDPYNYIDKPGNMPETEFVSDLLTKVKQFAVGHDVHVWFIAHPTKLKKDESGRYPPPGGYEISGSAAWFAKADCGLTVHRGSNDCETEIHMWKVRFKWIGKVGSVLLAYDPVTGRYTDGRSASPPSAGDRFILNDSFGARTNEDGEAIPAPWARN